MGKRRVCLYLTTFLMVLACVLMANLVVATPDSQPSACPAAATDTLTCIGDASDVGCYLAELYEEPLLHTAVQHPDRV